jgi:ferredoxin
MLAARHDPTGPHAGTGGSMVKRVVVDFDLCQSNGVCMGLAPEVFELRDDGFLYVLEEHPADDVLPRVHDAVVACPMQAISVVDD